jgi:hypothetical protein
LRRIQDIPFVCGCGCCCCVYFCSIVEKQRRKNKVFVDWEFVCTKVLGLR